MNPYYPHIFEPLTIKGVTFRNRIFTAPTTSHLLQDNSAGPSDEYIANFVQKAKGGAACVCFGGMLMSQQPQEFRPSHYSAFDITNPASWRDFIKFTDAIHLYGAKASFEVLHFGVEEEVPFAFKDQVTMYGASETVGPSGILFYEMPEDIMDKTADEYAEAAACAKSCGFDVLLIHGGHGCLFQQFLSPRTNKRSDQYGGSLENRAKFPMMVLDRIRERVGDSILIEYRISGTDFLEDGFTIEDCIQFMKLIEPQIDIAHISAGTARDPRIRARTHPSGFLPPAPNAYLAEAVKKSGIKVPVLTLGAFQEPSLIEQTLAEGKADIVAMARGMIADPELVNKAKCGKAKDIVPCIKCYHCMDDFKKTHYFSCAVNPLAGREKFIPMITDTITTPKKVAVIGGGPAGMEAALVASERGHQVVLYEKSSRLSGQLNEADVMPFKYDLRKFKDYLIYKLGESTVEVHLNVTPTVEMLQKENFDVVIAALGATPILPHIEGIDTPNVMLAAGCFDHIDTIGKKVVVIGGGQVGTETAVYNAMLGKNVTLIEMQAELAKDAQRTYREELIGQLYDRCQVVLNAQCQKVTSAGVYYLDAGGQEQFIAADTVLVAVGMRGKRTEAEQYRDAAPEFRMIGDCAKIGTVKHAIRAAYEVAMSL